MVLCDRRKSSKYLWSTLVIATIAACAAFLYISFSSEKRQVSSSQSSSPEMLTAEKCIAVCDTEECVSYSKRILDYINPDVNPCENFFQFACGKMFESFGPGEMNSIEQRYSKVIKPKLKRILDNAKADPSSATGKMKIVYDSCMKYGSSDLQALPTILEYLHGTGIRDWPNLDPDFKFTDISLSKVIANFLSHKEFGFIDFTTIYEYVELEDLTLKLNTTLIDKKGPYEKYDELARKYRVDRILKYFSLDPDTTNEIWDESEAILTAIENLREKSLRMEDQRESAAFLDCSQDTVNEWTDICESLESLIDITNAHDKVCKNYAAISRSSAYFLKNIFPLLRSFTDRSVANYLALNLFLNNLDELNFHFHLPNSKVVELLDEPDETVLKWKKCTRWISNNMALAMGYEYLKTDFPVSLLQDTQKIGEECISEASDLVSRQEWMTDEELANMKEKVQEVKINFQNMIEILTNETGINVFYEKFRPTKENFFHNVLQYKQFMRTSEMQGIVTIEDTQFAGSLFSVNAAGGSEVINIFLGLLVPPSYTPRLERFMNLLSLGLTLTHELGHGLDSFYKIGYYSKVKCLEDQYSQFTVETIGKNLIGSQYFKEIFADTIAISVIDKLIEKYAYDNSSSLMPSLSYSLMQQMYINTVNGLCKMHTKEIDEMSYKYSGHPPERFRINGVIQNSKVFSKAFGCEEGDPMNPLTKCFILQ